MWSMDFVSDALFDGRRLRALTVVDAFTREALAIDVDQGIKGEQVVEAMTRIASSRGAPRTIRVDNVQSRARMVRRGRRGVALHCAG
jgi:putative transposase